MLRISGWKRIGIIASIVWIIGAYVYTLSREQNADIALAVSLYRACEEAHHGFDPECDKPLYDDNQGLYEPEPATVVAFVRVPLAWGFVYLTLSTLGWVRRGFGELERNPPKLKPEPKDMACGEHDQQPLSDDPLTRARCRAVARVAVAHELGLEAECVRSRSEGHPLLVLKVPESLLKKKRAQDWLIVYYAGM